MLIRVEMGKGRKSLPSRKRGSARHALAAASFVPLLKNECVEMGEPAPPRRRTHGGTGAGRWPSSSPCHRRRWPEGQVLQGLRVPGHNRRQRTDGLWLKAVRSRRDAGRAAAPPTRNSKEPLLLLRRKQFP
jgi:hypothetical protein